MGFEPCPLTVSSSVKGEEPTGPLGLLDGGNPYQYNVLFNLYISFINLFIN